MPTSAILLDLLIDHLRSRDGVVDGQERPAAILWTDPKGEWRSVISLLSAHVDELLVLGPYQPNARSGPAIWLKCVVDRALPSPALPPHRPAIVYLPDVARQTLRAGDECPEALRPLVELMFRGAMWLHPGGTDWGVSTFLTSPKGLGLDISRDSTTADALMRALPEVLQTPLDQLTGRRLHADDFDRMLAADVVRDVLRWMCDPSGTRARMGENGFAAFRSRCVEDLRFDPAIDTDTDAGRMLADSQDGWSDVWDRFVEAPSSYREITGVLRRSRPAHGLFAEPEHWPHLNETAETDLRTALTTLTSKPAGEVTSVIARLESEHGRRRSSVWARLGMAPLAELLAPLSTLAAQCRSTLGGATPDDVARGYVEHGWQADAAAWEALASARVADEQLVSDLVRAIHGPWLDDSARAFQAAVDHESLPTAETQSAVEADSDGCVMFVDGLRYDVAQRLSERLEGRGCRVILNHRWAATPTVTATAKPASSPAAKVIAGERLGGDFSPRLTQGDKAITAQSLRDAIQQKGYQVLGEGMFDAPATHSAKGWLEAGDIDTLGHQLGAGLARQLDDEIDRLVERTIALLEAGWKSVRVVTDHGWLLLPGGLPKVDLPRHLAESRWSRCAVLAGGAASPVPLNPWYWNRREMFASAPGVACFKRSEEYSHGGLSVQECVIPDLRVERAGGDVVSATIQSITWRGLRCNIEASVRGGGVVADLRLGRAAGASVVAAAKAIDPDGSVSLVLAGDEHESSTLVLVLLDSAENVLAQKATRVGEDS